MPFAPYYFPQVVQTPGATSRQDLTGYFDWRPKDGDEAVVVADSTDGGLTWTVEGEALDQNGGYCPSADTNDDGNGHPYVADLGTGGSSLYTLQRAAGDTAGTGLLVHSLSAATSTDPLNGVPSTESIGVDPNTFATTPTTLSVGATATSIPVSTLGGDAENGTSTTVDGQTIPDPSEIPNATATYEVGAVWRPASRSTLSSSSPCRRRRRTASRTTPRMT